MGNKVLTKKQEEKLAEDRAKLANNWYFQHRHELKEFNTEDSGTFSANLNKLAMKHNRKYSANEANEFMAVYSQYARADSELSPVELLA